MAIAHAPAPATLRGVRIAIALFDQCEELDWAGPFEVLAGWAQHCTGALVFAAAGLLDGHQATTDWGSLELLAQLGERIEVRGDERFIDTGDVITAAGVDMALHLVARLHSRERAVAVRREIQYDPQPPV